LPQRPNILVFMTDQQHHATIEADSPLPMRNVLTLAERGLRLNRAFTPCPQCTPARASMMTGLYPHRHKLLTNSHSALSQRDALPPGIPTLGDVFREAGYRTACVGKWHVGLNSPADHGFEVPAAPRAKPKQATLTDQVMPIGEAAGPRPLAATSDQPAEQTGPFVVADDLVQLLEQHHAGGDSRPLFAFASCTPPHVPWYPPEPYASMVDPASLEEPASYRDDLSDKPLTYRHHTGINFANVGGNWSEFAKAKAKYFGVCRLIDDAFGRVLEALDRLNMAGNTLVVFTTDHGEMLGAHGLVGKNELACEELIRIPMVMAGPGIEPGATDVPVTLCDLFATFMAAAGIGDEPPADSRDFSALFTSTGRDELQTRPFEPVIIQHHGTSHLNAIRAIRTDKWKYTYRPHEIHELYDIENDPDELRNLIDDPALSDTLRELRFELLAWLRQRKDILFKGVASTFVHLYGWETVSQSAAYQDHPVGQAGRG
jgi:arylsulfatase A-like enzyme